MLRNEQANVASAACDRISKAGEKLQSLQSFCIYVQYLQFKVSYHIFAWLVHTFIKAISLKHSPEIQLNK